MALWRSIQRDWSYAMACSTWLLLTQRLETELAFVGERDGERVRSACVCRGMCWRLTQDLRNHGASPHAETMTYADMAADVQRFLERESLQDVALIGHSLGGKVAMALALNPALPSGTLSHLVSVDMTPAKGPISAEFREYVNAMVEIEDAHVSSRGEADEILARTEPDLSVRQFLLTNLEMHEGSMHFRIPIRTMQKSLDEIGKFPYSVGEHGDSPERQWDGRTLFVKGAQSKYINRRNLPICRAFFPAMELVVMETGHWCQAEDPKTFVRHISDFLTKSPT